MPGPPPGDEWSLVRALRVAVRCGLEQVTFPLLQSPGNDQKIISIKEKTEKKNPIPEAALEIALTPNSSFEFGETLNRRILFTVETSPFSQARQNRLTISSPR